MPSDVLSSNFDLLNIGSGIRRSHSNFTSRETNERQRSAAKENSTVGIFVGITRRRAAASKAGMDRPLAFQAESMSNVAAAPSLTQAIPGGRLLRAKSTNASSVAARRRGSHLLQNHGRTTSSSALLTVQPHVTEDARQQVQLRSSSSFLIGKKRKRQLPTPQMQTRSSSNNSTSGAGTSRSNKINQGEKAPTSQASLASSISILASDSDSGLGSFASRRTSKSSLSLGQPFGEMLLDSQWQSSRSSPAAGRRSSAGGLRRRASSRKTSRCQQKLATESDKDEDVNLSTDDGNDDDAVAAGPEIERNDLLLSDAPAPQLERLQKAALVNLAASIDIPTRGMTKAQIVRAILARQIQGFYASSSSSSFSSSSSLSSSSSCSPSPSSQRTPLTRCKSSSVSTRLAVKTPISARSNSADYTDESEGEYVKLNYEHGNEGGGEEMEPEPTVYDVVKRHRRPTRQPMNNAMSQKRSPGRGKTRHDEQVLYVDLCGSGGSSNAIDISTAASPMVNRLRKQRSLHFASPVRGRNRARLERRHALPVPPREFSPLKLRPRRAKEIAQKGGPTAVARHRHKDEYAMEEDWVDDVVVAERPRRIQRRRQRLDKPHLETDVAETPDSKMDEDAEEVPAEDQSEGGGALNIMERQSVHRRRSSRIRTSPTDGAKTAEDDGDADSEVDNKEDAADDTDDAEETATELQRLPEAQDDRYVDSDATDTPEGRGQKASPRTSPSCPLKIRRLRNGKLRMTLHSSSQGELAAIGALGDTDHEVESQLTIARPLISLSGHQLRNVKTSKSSSQTAQTSTPATATKAEQAASELHSSNGTAKTAEGEHIDELNGLDIESLHLTDKEIPSRQLSKTSKIGSGGFKDVYVGIWRVGKRRNKVAIADIREKLTEMDIKELGLLRDLKHENIVRFIGISIPEDTARTGIPCMIVSELCSNGDLWDYIRNVKPPSTLDIFRMLLQTARGLEYLHMHSIVHRDVKSTNVLVTRNRSCKINDFGLARVKKSQRSKMHSVVGTVNWQAVELWCAMPQYNEKVDVWSAAMTFWEVLQWHEEYQSYPFEGMNEFMIYEEVGKKGMRPCLKGIEEGYGDEIARLLSRMWEADPRKRPTMDMVCADLEHLIETKRIELGA